MAPDAPAARETLKALLRDEIGPELRRRGLKGSGGRYRLDRGDYRGWIEIQRSTRNDASFCEFTFNVGALNRLRSDGYWYDRIGEVLPPGIGGGDIWWVVPRGASVDDLCSDLLWALCDHAVVAVQAATDGPQCPPEPGKVSARTFQDPRRLWPEDVTHLMTDPVAEPWWRRGRGGPGRKFDPTYEDLLAEAERIDFEDRDWDYRSNLFQLHLDDVPAGDVRCVPALTEVLAKEPLPRNRADAAGALGGLGLPPDIVVPYLVAADEQDSDARVRLYARYTRRLLERTPT